MTGHVCWLDDEELVRTKCRFVGDSYTQLSDGRTRYLCTKEKKTIDWRNKHCLAPTGWKIEMVEEAKKHEDNHGEKPDSRRARD